MVAHLEEVHASHLASPKEALHLVSLGVSGEKRREGLAAGVVGDRHLERVGVLGAVGGACGGHDHEREPAYADPVVVADLARPSAREPQDGIAELWGDVVGHPGAHDHLVHAHDALEMRDAAVVVVVQVGDDDSVEMHDVLLRERRDDGVVRPGIHQNRARAVLHEDGVALPHVEHADARRGEKPPAHEERDACGGEHAGRHEHAPAAEAGPGGEERDGEPHDGGPERRLAPGDGDRCERHTRESMRRHARRQAGKRPSRDGRRPEHGDERGQARHEPRCQRECEERAQHEVREGRHE
jgi:hypothetical protein